MSVLRSGPERFTAGDLEELSALVAATWTASAHGDWSAHAGTVGWSCTATADHAVDCVYAPAFFLASRRTDAYPHAGGDLTMGEDATPERLVESLAIATRVLVAVVRDATDDVRSVIFRRPRLLGAPGDFLPRGAMELALHAHDVCVGLAVPFEPPPAIARRLREHTRPWPMWTTEWDGLGDTDDAWGDLLTASGRERTA
ncbi:MAG: hypothetical protein ABWZ42_06745 [Ilumatobacteraceae bacterium]